jgi:signal transduction histidine kinase
MSSDSISRYWQAALRAMAVAALVVWGLVVADVARQVDRPFAGFRCEEGLSVSPQTDPAWSGPQAGLRAYDYVLSANGRRLARVAELKAIVAAAPAGTPIRYEVWRQGRVETVVAPTQVLSWRDAASGFGPVLLVGLLHMLIGVAGFWLRPAHPAAQAHLVLTLLIGLSFQTLGVDFTLTHRFGRFYQSTVHLVGSALIYLAVVFPEPGSWVKRRPWLLGAVWAPSVALAGIQAATYHPVGLAARGAPSGGPHYDWLFLAWGGWLLMGFAALAVRMAHTAWRGPTLDARRQGRLVLVGTLLAFTPGLALYLVPTLLGRTEQLSMALVILAQASLACFPLSIALAILRYRLFEIDVLIKRAAMYSPALAALTALYGAVFYAVGHLGSHRPGLASGLAALVVGLACVPSMQASRRVLERWFFRAPYDFQAVTTQFAAEARSKVRLDDLLASFAPSVEGALHPTFLAVMGDEGADGWRQVHGQGLPPAYLTDSAFLDSASRALRRSGGLKPVDLSWDDDRVLLVPVAAAGERLGALVLGGRKAGLPYDPPDRHLLAHLAEMLALRWQNVRLFDQLVRHNEQLAAAVAELRQLDELKRQFLNAVSHELRTPLSSIVGFGEFLNDEVGGPLAPIQQEFVHHIRTGSKRLQSLVDDLLDYAQMEAGSFRVEPRWTDLAPVVVEALESLQPQASASKVTIVPELPEGPVEGEFDPARIEQVILNLVGNAIKFTPKGGSVRVRVAAEPGVLRLAVADTGIGIPDEVMSRLFDKFFQVDPTTTRRYGGTGLGLAIAKAIVEAHGGAIAVESAVGAGSTFSVSLPTGDDMVMTVPQRAPDSVEAEAP